jgi:single-strand DNA-binding protein
MASFNRVVLIGNLCRDVELKYTQAGLAVTEVGLAVNDKRKNAAGEWVEEVTFVDVTLFARSAEVASEYCQKGSCVLIEGRLKLDTWKDKNTGDKRSKLRVMGERLVMLGGKPKDGTSSPPADPGGYQPAASSSPTPAREPGYDDEPARAVASGEPDDMPF